MKKKIFRKIFIAFLLLTAILILTIVYLNKVVLPVKLKSLITRALSSQIRKEVALESVQFNLLRGIVLRNLNVYDGQKILIGVKEAAFSFLILPILKEKKIIIPSIRLIEPAIFLERRADNTLNLFELMPKKAPEEERPRFGLAVSGINVIGGHIDFQDDTFAPHFTQSIIGLDLDISLSLPASIKFEAKGKIKTAPGTSISINGHYLIPRKELNAKISISDLTFRDFSPYYSNFGLSIRDGKADASIDLRLKDNLLTLEAAAQNKNMVLAKDKISLSLNSDIWVSLRYNLEDKQLAYSGKADIAKTNISGIETFDEIKDISGRINFNDSGINSDKILAAVFGLPIEAKIALTDFKNPTITLEAASELSLSALQGIAAEKLRISLPAEVTGLGKLSLKVKTQLPLAEPPQISGSLAITSAAAKIDKIAFPLQDIRGLITFDADKLNWSKGSVSYQDTVYKTEGALVNYKNPEIALTLSSPELSLSAGLSIKDSIIKISELKGKYLGSSFFLKGDLDITDAQSIRARINADTALNLEDLKKPLPKFKERFEQIKPSGIVKARISLDGSINHPKLCAIKAEASSPSLSLYGLKSDAFDLQYSQYQGLADIPVIHLSFYGGAVSASAKANLDAPDFPFWIEAKIDNVKLEKLKEDTPAKKQDIAGTIQAIAKLNGYASDLSKLSGAGKISIENGKLWELNLFKGIGKLIFTKDFTNIVFTRGACEFFVKDKFIFSDNLQLESELTNLKGGGKIGFDSSIDANINVEISNEFVPGSGTIKDLTTALMGEVPRFAVIKIRGTLAKPEYVFDIAVVDVLKGLTGSILEGIFGQ